jgi:hypothetical protein
MGNGFDASLGSLADCVGEPPPELLDDEHLRWEFYQKAMQIGSCRRKLMAAVSLDPDPVLALTVALQMLETEDAHLREEWIAQLRDERQRQYASRRVRELEILEAFGRVPGLSRDVVLTWSDWLQVRLAEVSTVVEVLEHLKEHGKTKRIRRTASRRLAAL